MFCGLVVICPGDVVAWFAVRGVVVPVGAEWGVFVGFVRAVAVGSGVGLVVSGGVCWVPGGEAGLLVRDAVRGVVVPVGAEWGVFVGFVRAVAVGSGVGLVVSGGVCWVPGGEAGLLVRDAVRVVGVEDVLGNA